MSFVRLSVLSFTHFDSVRCRVADDMGKLRLQFKIFHKPLFGWKGSFVVTQVSFSVFVSFSVENGVSAPNVAAKQRVCGVFEGCCGTKCLL